MAKHTKFLPLLHNAWPAHRTSDPVNYTLDKHFSLQVASETYYPLGIPLKRGDV